MKAEQVTEAAAEVMERWAEGAGGVARNTDIGEAASVLGVTTMPFWWDKSGLIRSRHPASRYRQYGP